MKLDYRYCREAMHCQICQAFVLGKYAFELHRHEYDPFEFLRQPNPHWLCSERCVRAWDNREPADPSSEDNGPRDEAHRMQEARRLK
jgi:hypothetical protein